MLLLLCAVLLAGGFAAREAYLFLNTPASDRPEDIIITIAPGATFDRVAWDLKKAGAISDVTRFRLLAYAKKALGRIKAGEFQINTGWTPEQVLHQITEGQAVLYRLSLREGLTWWETAKEIEAQGFARYEDFKAVIHDPIFLREHNIPFANAEGFLYPETYLLKKPRSPLDRQQAYDVASTMVRMFWKKTEPLWKGLPEKAIEEGAPEGAMRSPAQNALTAQANAAAAHAQANATAATAQANATAATAPEAPATALPRIPADNAGVALSTPTAGKNTANASSPLPGGRGANATAAPPPAGPQSPAQIDPQALRKLVILASLVEKETGVAEERMRVAGVYANRLALGMLLQCDPTIIYGVGENFSGAIRRSQIDDPQNLYNTYQHAGLPPGPIASPGLHSLLAAATPEKHDYLYFVATGLSDGGHTFSKSLNEHNKAVQIYRSRMRGKP